MTHKKNYEAPAMEVVELKLQGSLLAGSDFESTGSFGETVSLDDDVANWD